MKVNNFGFVVAVVVGVVLLGGECNADLKWQLNRDTLVVFADGDGETMPDYPSGGPWNEIEDQVKKVVIGESLTSIGAYAFMYMLHMEEVTITKNIKSIGPSAFAYCPALKTINVDSGNTVYHVDDYGALYNSSGIILYPAAKSDSTSYQIPSGIKEIASYAFSGSKALTTVEIPSSVKYIGVGAFFKCANLQNVQLPPDVSIIYDFTFGYCSKLSLITIPNKVEIIGSYVFAYSNLTEVVIPNSVTRIGRETFRDNHYLRSVHLGKVYEVGNDCFSGCERLQRVTTDYPMDLTGSTEYPFRGTTILRAICVPSNYQSTRFGRWELTKNCPALDEIPEGLKWSLNDGTLTITGEGRMLDYTENDLQAPWYPDRESIKRIVIGGQVIRIGAFAFNKCNNFEEIVIPKSCVKIDNSAFVFCQGLKNITVEDGNPQYYSLDGVLFNFTWHPSRCLVRFPPSKIPKNGYYAVPDGVVFLGSFSFYNCQGLKTVTLPDSVGTIAESAFGLCNNLTKVISGSGLDTLGRNCLPISSSKFTRFYYHHRGYYYCSISLSNAKYLTVCVPSDFTSNEFCYGTVTKTGDCASFMDMYTPCYEPKLVVNDDGSEEVIQTKRKNATKWEDQSTECMSYTCEDGPNSASACNSDNQVSRFCVADKCIDNWNTRTIGWFVSIPLNDVSIGELSELNMSNLIENISSLSQVSKDDMTIGTETNEAGLMVTYFSIQVKDEESAKSIANAVNGITEEGCAYGVLCNHGDAAFFYNENKPSSSSSFSSSLSSRSSSSSPSFSSSSSSLFSSSSSFSSGIVIPGSSGVVTPGSTGTSDIKVVSGALSAHNMMVKTTMALMVMLSLMML